MPDDRQPFARAAIRSTRIVLIMGLEFAEVEAQGNHASASPGSMRYYHICPLEPWIQATSTIGSFGWSNACAFCDNRKT